VSLSIIVKGIVFLVRSFLLAAASCRCVISRCFNLLSANMSQGRKDSAIDSPSYIRGGNTKERRKRRRESAYEDYIPKDRSSYAAQNIGSNRSNIGFNRSSVGSHQSNIGFNQSNAGSNRLVSPPGVRFAPPTNAWATTTKTLPGGHPIYHNNALTPQYTTHGALPKVPTCGQT